MPSGLASLLETRRRSIALAEVLGSLGAVMGPSPERNVSSFHQRMLAARLRDPELRSEFERVRAEMFEQLAPATEGHRVNVGRKRRGRLVFGDADE